MEQFLTFSLARPSLERLGRGPLAQGLLRNGKALKRYMESIRMSLDFRRLWPQQPLHDTRPLEYCEGIVDVRTGSCLDGEEQIIFEHPSEGLIRFGGSEHRRAMAGYTG